MKAMSVTERILRSIRRTESGCWEWMHRRDGDGYGQCSVKRGSHLAHRVSYEAFVGPIPEGLQLDHLCRNRACVNPGHLEPVTGAENQRRGILGSATRCIHGHPYDTANTYLRPKVGGGRRDCRRCIADRVARYRARRKAA